MTQATEPATGSIPATSTPKRQVWLLIGITLVAAFVMILNETVMSIAIPDIMADFSVTASTAQWLTTVFMLTMAVVIPSTGFLLQRVPTRAVYVAALTSFTVGTAIAVIAPAFWALVIARVLQAAGTAIILPLLSTAILTFVPVNRRGTMFGFMGIVISVAPALGPTLSGALISASGWRMVFIVMLPIGIVALLLGAVFMRNIGTITKTSIDVLSVVLSAIAFGTLIFGLSSIGEATEGRAAISPVIPIVIGVLSLVLFVWRQIRLQQRDAALLDLRPFRERSFWIGVVVLLIAQASLFGALILLPLYLQNVLGLSALAAGLVVLPGGLLMGVMAPIIGALYDRVGARPLAIPGALILTTALTLMGFLLDERSTQSVAMMLHMMVMLGLGMLMTPLMTSALGSVPQPLYSHGSAIINTLQQLAGALGTALFITLMTLGTTAAISSGAEPVAAQASGMQQAFLVGAGVSVLALISTFFIGKTKPANAVAAE